MPLMTTANSLRPELLIACVLLAIPSLSAADDRVTEFPAKAVRPFLDAHCLGCHDTATKKGGLDLETLPADLQKPETFRTWVKIHDQIRSGEMPPAKRKRPPQAETDASVGGLDAALVAADRRRQTEGRAVFRRLNRTEYENSLRDLLALPGLSVRELLPEDGRAHGFDKSGTALDLSHVQLAKYMEAAEVALGEAIAPFADKPEVFKQRIYPAHEWSFHNLLMFGDAVFLKDMKYDHGTFPIIHDEPALKNDGAALDKIGKSYTGAVGVFRHADESNHLGFNRQFGAHFSGRYRLKLSLWGFHWDKGEVKHTARTEAVGLTANGRLLGYFDAPSLKPTVHEIEVWLNRKEVIELNAASLWPNAGVSARKGRLADYVGPGIAIDWLEVEGPLHDTWPPAGHRRLFGDLPLGPMPTGDIPPPKRVDLHEWYPTRAVDGPGKFTHATVVSKQPAEDAERLLADFLRRAFRRPVTPEEVRRYVGVVQKRLEAKVGFEEAMRTAYKAALCSPSFLFLKEAPGKLGDAELSSRLSYFLWNSTPDEALAAKDGLRDPEALRAQVERMLSDAKAGRFVEDFPDQWLDLRDINSTTPDARLYPEFNTMLRDAMLGESRAYFGELLKKDLGVAHVVGSDFAMLNQRLAAHYRIPGVTGTAIRRVDLPTGSHRGGFLTQAAVLKVTANGTTTTPVKRGVWVQSKILGRPPEPPPRRASGRAGRARHHDHPRTARQASVQRGLRFVPRADRSAGLRAGELRRDRRLADALPPDGPRRGRNRPGREYRCAGPPFRRARGGPVRRNRRWPRLRRHRAVQKTPARRRAAARPQLRRPVARVRHRRARRLRRPRRRGSHPRPGQAQPLRPAHSHS